MITEIITRIVWESTKENIPEKYSRRMSDKEQKGQLIYYKLDKNLTILDFLGRRERKKAAMKSMESIHHTFRLEGMREVGRKHERARGETQSSAEPGCCESMKGKASVWHQSAASEEVSLTA